MPTRTAEARWNGTLKEGGGSMKLGSGAFEGQYSFTSRFADGTGTNPEELIGAALAGCFSMALAGMLQEEGFEPRSIHTTSKVSVEPSDAGFTITSAELHTEGDVAGIDLDTFSEYAQSAKDDCPVGRALKGVRISVEAKLPSVAQA